MKKSQFKTKFGVIAATVGSAVGLGNIWRFPYEAGTHGGGAFLLLNLCFVLVIGIPIISAEFMIGHHTACDVYAAFRKFKGGNRWRVVGWLGLVAAILILGFYSVVAGWTVEYIYQSVINFGGASTSSELHLRFSDFAGSTFKPLWWTLGFLMINYIILLRGVEKGIEKMSNIMLPVLFVILVAFMINSLTLPKAGEGLEFLFTPDFSSITPGVIIGALGQAFFSLSLGLGCMITYSSYFKEDTPLVKTAVSTAMLDTLVAVIAGVIIFPAVFTFGQEPAAGPQLVFEILPSIFQNMTLGLMWSTLFFVLLFLASLTSTISMFEIIIAFLERSRGMSRSKAVTLTVCCATCLAVICSLSFGPLADVRVSGLTFFNLFDYLSSNICLPLGGMLISIFAGWVVSRSILVRELEGRNPNAFLLFAVKFIVFCLRYVAPIGIAIVFITGL